MNFAVSTERCKPKGDRRCTQTNLRDLWAYNFHREFERLDPIWEFRWKFVRKRETKSHRASNNFSSCKQRRAPWNGKKFFLSKSKPGRSKTNIWIAVDHFIDDILLQTSGVQMFDFVLGVVDRRRNVFNDHFSETFEFAEESSADKSK